MAGRTGWWMVLAALGAGCVPAALQEQVDATAAAVDAAGSDHEAVVQLQAQLAEAQAAIAALQSTVDGMRSVGDEVGALRNTVAAMNSDLSVLSEHERRLAAEVIAPGFAGADVPRDVAGLDGLLQGSRLDVAVSVADLADGLAAARTTVAGDVATALGFGASPAFAPDETYGVLRDLLAAQDAVEAAVGVIADDYLRAEDLAGYARQSSVDLALAGYATHAELAAAVDGVDVSTYATQADVAAVSGRVSVIEGDYLQAADIAATATRAWVTATYPEQAELDAALATLAAQDVALDDHDLRLRFLEAATLDVRLVRAEEDLVLLRRDLTGFARVIDDDQVIRVPTDAPTIQAALDSLQDAVIDARARVDIVVESAGCGPQPGPIVARHRDGARIHLRSASGNAASCVLSFPDAGVWEDDYGGVLVKQGATLGELSGFTLRGPPDGVLPGGGVQVDERSALLQASNLVLEGWQHGPGLYVANASYFAGDAVRAQANDGGGVWATGVSAVVLDRSSAAAENRAAGFTATDGAMLRSLGAWATGNAGPGYRADTGAVLIADTSTTCEAGACGDPGRAHGNAGDGFSVGGGATLSASASVAQENDGAGFAVGPNSTLAGAGANAYANGDAGFVVALGGVLDGPLAQAVGNGGAGFAVDEMGLITLVDGTSSDNAGAGVRVAGRSWLDASGALLIDNAGDGAQASAGGWCDVTGATVVGNAAGFSVTPNAAYPDATWLAR